VGSGNFKPLLDWLRAKVHHVGRRRSATQLIEDVTGLPPTPDAFLRYLEKKYHALYGVV
jgi:carboxypeptidase Taq